MTNKSRSPAAARAAAIPCLRAAALALADGLESKLNSTSDGIRSYAMTIEATALNEKTVGAQPAMKVAVTSAKAPDYVEGRRSFFKYRDLGVTAASNGWMRAQLTTALTGMTKPTGWHYHVCEGQFVYTLKGWVELEFEDGTSCRLEAGDSCFIPGGMRHNEIGTSDDLEILEVCLPANMGTVPVDPPAGRPNGS
jgi:mannose-6-phosphate isomerase-like protein (cupin superfamily)